MTEQEWLTASDPQRMSLFAFIHNGNNGRESGRRKLRLYACAHCRFRWAKLIEKWADGFAQKDEVADALAQSVAARREIRPRGAASDEIVAAQRAVDVLGPSMESFVGIFRFDLSIFPEELVFSPEETYLVKVLRCLFGNPFRPISFDPAWLTSNARSVAEAIDADRQMPSGTFDNQRMGVLADALEEAGCNSGDILDHCRNGGHHFRGCWVVDRLLGKE